MQSRRWCFTWNNPDVDAETEHLAGAPASLRYATWQRERGECGTEHLQGYAEFSKPLRLAAVRKWLAQAHWEPSRGSREQVRFACCSKAHVWLRSYPGGFLHGVSVPCSSL